MKQKLRIAVFGAVCLPGLLLADSFTQTPTSPQQYRDVNSAQAASSQVANNSADNQSAQNPAVPQYQVNDNHIAYLSNKTDNMMVQINNLNHMVTMLGQQIERLKAAKSDSFVDSTVSFWDSGLSWVEAIGSTAYMNLGGAAVLLMGVGFVVGRASRPARKPLKAAKMTAAGAAADEDAKDTEAEYDFMATDEAIPAQLDLARSYLAMDDSEQAKAVLEKVMTRGNEAQKNEAKSLLHEIAQKTAQSHT